MRLISVRKYSNVCPQITGKGTRCSPLYQPPAPGIVVTNIQAPAEG